MKILVITLLLLLWAADVQSQQESISDDPADISVLKVGVRKSQGKVPYYYEEGGRGYRGSRPSSLKYDVVFTIKNTGAKTIKVIEWRYLSAKRHTGDQEWWTYKSKKKVRPGKKAEITGRLLPWDGAALPRESLDHRVVITRIEYTDSSVWERR